MNIWWVCFGNTACVSAVLETETFKENFVQEAEIRRKLLCNRNQSIPSVHELLFWRCRSDITWKKTCAVPADQFQLSSEECWLKVIVRLWAKPCALVTQVQPDCRLCSSWLPLIPVLSHITVPVQQVIHIYSRAWPWHWCFLGCDQKESTFHNMRDT